MNVFSFIEIVWSLARCFPFSSHHVIGANIICMFPSSQEHHSWLLGKKQYIVDKVNDSVTGVQVCEDDAGGIVYVHHRPCRHNGK